MKTIPLSEKYQIALFTLIRNHILNPIIDLPIGTRKGKTMEDINLMAFMTMIEMVEGDLIAWDNAKESLKQAERLFWKGKS